MNFRRKFLAVINYIAIFTVVCEPMFNVSLRNTLKLMVISIPGRLLH